MVPILEIDDFEEFNRKLAEDCHKDLERKLRGKSGTNSELLEEDRRAMLPIPHDRCEARRVKGGKANTLLLIRFDRNDYSVPTRYAHREATVVGSPDRVRIVADSHVVAEHVRDWESENVHYDPVHYLALGAVLLDRCLQWPLVGPPCAITWPPRDRYGSSVGQVRRLASLGEPSHSCCGVWAISCENGLRIRPNGTFPVPAGDQNWVAHLSREIDLLRGRNGAPAICGRRQRALWF